MINFCNHCDHCVAQRFCGNEFRITANSFVDSTNYIQNLETCFAVRDKLKDPSYCPNFKKKSWVKILFC